MSGRICFIGDGEKAVWPLPFVPGDAQSLIVSVQPAGGVERMLAAGSGYSVSGSMLICPLSRGAYLYVQEREEAAAQAAPYGAAAYSSQPVQGALADPAPAYIPEASGMDGGEAARLLEERYYELSGTLKAEISALAAKLKSELAELARERTDAASALIGDLARKGRDEAALALAPKGQRGRLSLANGAPAGAYLTAPVSYLRGAAQLAVFSQGLLLAEGADYEECGPLNEASATIRALGALPAGAVLDFIVTPLSSAESARLSADQARAAGREAAVMLAAAKEESESAARTLAGAGAEITMAQGWAAASQKSADAAYQASVRAFESAAQISLLARRPGICAVKDKADIHGCSPGLFIINPHLTHAPTPFSASGRRIASMR